MALSICTGTLDTVYNEELDRAFGGLKLKAELLLKGNGQNWALRIGYGCAGDLVDEVEMDIECTTEVRPVDYWKAERYRKDTDQL